MKTALIGHRQIIANNIENRLLIAIKQQIEKGCKKFTMGTHGAFDSLALSACKHLREIYPDLEIEVAITSLNAIKKDTISDYTPYSDVQTVMYDIECAHYKQQITLSNKLMLDTCDALICYVDDNYIHPSGARTAMQYANKIGLKIINLYRKEDTEYSI